MAEEYQTAHINVELSKYAKKRITVLWNHNARKSLVNPDALFNEVCDKIETKVNEKDFDILALKSFYIQLMSSKDTTHRRPVELAVSIHDYYVI